MLVVAALAATTRRLGPGSSRGALLTVSPWHELGKESANPSEARHRGRRGYLAAMDDDTTTPPATTPEGSVLTVVGRWDFHVTDREALLTAGRAAYRMNQPDAGAAEALQVVTTAEQATHELLEAGGVDAVYDADGVEPERVFTVALTHDEDDDESFEADPFAIAYEDAE